MGAPDYLKIISQPEEVSMGDAWFEVANLKHFWVRWRFDAGLRLLSKIVHPGQKVIEVGCGHGLFRAQVEDHFKLPVDGCDLNLFAISQAPKGLGNLYTYNVFDRRPEMLAKFDTVFLMDVIEHIPDDAAFIKACGEMLKPGGSIVVNVPAFMALFSKYDKAAGHLRRYNKLSLKAAAEKAGLEFVEASYWGLLLTPIAVIRKFWLSLFSDDTKILHQGFKPPGEFANSAMLALMHAERLLPFPLPFGTSLFAILRKKGS